jgi:DNA invertase Pin-like site-specific DNA recombinase
MSPYPRLLEALIDGGRAHELCGPSQPPTARAAEYVRMSTEHQRYSIDNQSEAILRYARNRGYEIVRTYADKGKSGLSLAGRLGLQELLDDVESGRADYQALLVYDISRFGRFQDTDEAAMYELRCRRAGVAVHYCAEHFENDGSIGSTILKTVKRLMAGEFSRELSVKVFAAQSNIVRLGFRSGGPAGFGLRRLVIDHEGNPRFLLAPRQWKAVSTDRVILVPGPDQEIVIVGEIYRRFVVERTDETAIATILNHRGVSGEDGRPWTRRTVHEVLTNEKYVGDNVWGRVSRKLRVQKVANSRHQWIRRDRAFQPIVGHEIFQRAQAIVESRRNPGSDEELLDKLRSLLNRHGRLSESIVDAAPDAPSGHVYRKRFGALSTAYALIGYSPVRNYQYVDDNRRLRGIRARLIGEIVARVEERGATIARDAETDLVTINGEFTASIVLLRCVKNPCGSARWDLRSDPSLTANLTVATRLAEDNQTPKDYYLLPRSVIARPCYRLSERNGLPLDAYRFDSLDCLYQMATRQPLRRHPLAAPAAVAR